MQESGSVMFLPLLSIKNSGDGLVAIFDEIEDTILYGDSAIMSTVTKVSVSLAAIGVIFAMVKITNDYIENHGVTFFQLLRPFVVFTCVCFFSTLVFNPLNAMVNIFSMRLADAVGSVKGDFYDVWEQSIEEVIEKNKDYIDSQISANASLSETENTGSGFWNFLSTATVATTNLFADLFNQGKKILCDWLNRQTGMKFDIVKLLLSPGAWIPALCYWLYKIVGMAFMCIARINMIILGVVGPFTFALAIMPWFPNGLKLWVEKFIQYGLWIPMVYIIDYICLSFVSLSNTMSFGGSLTSTLCYFVCIVAVFEVPKLVSAMIEGTAGEYAGSGMMSSVGSMNGAGGMVLRGAKSFGKRFIPGLK